MMDGTTVNQTAYKSTKMCRCECSRDYKNKYTLKRHQDTVCPYYAEMRARTKKYRIASHSPTAPTSRSLYELDVNNDHGSGYTVEVPHLPLKKRRCSEKWKMISQCETINPKRKLKNGNYFKGLSPKNSRFPYCRRRQKKKKRAKCFFVEEDHNMTSDFLTTANSVSEVAYVHKKLSTKTLMFQGTNRSEKPSLRSSNSSNEMNKSNLLFERIFHDESRTTSVAVHSNRPVKDSIVLSQQVSENESSSPQSAYSERVQYEKIICDSTGSCGNNKENRCDASTQTCPQYISFRISIFGGDKVTLHAIPTSI